ncbi:MAG: ATP-binding cassette domain-containing protein [Firmicutes bacterium]|nr:ATP-binding cassette domain-containing protein [Bacillota bacterium]
MFKKVVVRQQDIKDCGAACLLSIIKYYGGNISLEKIKIDSCISSSGISAFNLIAAAKRYGFDGRGTRISFDDLIKSKLVYPFISYVELKNGLRHYIVVYEITKKYILVMDPAKGLRKLKYDEFKSIYKDIIIEFSLISNVINYSKDNKLLNIFLRYIKSDNRLIIRMFITSLLLTIVSIISSFMIKVIIGNVDSNNKGMFYFIILIFFIITLLKVILDYLRTYFENYINKNIDCSLLPDFIKHIFNIPLNAISNRTSGEIITRVNELNNLKELFANMFVTLVLNLLLVITSIIVLMIINVKLTIILLLVIFIYLINNLIWIKPINNYIEDNINYQTSFNSSLTNSLNHIISVKNNKSFTMSKLNNKIYEYLYNTFSINNKINIYNFINTFILEIGLFILNSFALMFVINNTLELLDLITYNSLYMFFINPIKDIINLIPKYVYIRRSFIKINDFLMLEEESNKKKESFKNGDIEFNNIDYSYNMYDYPIKNYSLKIRENSKVLVMGKSGSGKSTLFKLLDRLYNPIKGSIKINNINILDYSLDTIRNNISYISQDEAIFNDTIFNNITLNMDVDKNKLNTVLELCEVNDILNKKSLRLDTMIREDVSNLSGGERSRIIMARELLKDNPIIIFDETFSAVEEGDANKMINNIFNYYNNKTFIIISHFKPSYHFDLVVSGGFNG